MSSGRRAKKPGKEISDLHFHPLLKGSVTCWHRPTPLQIHDLATITPCSLVVTCQGPGESPADIKNACKANGLKWLWVKMTGANQALMGAAHFQQPVMMGLATVRTDLMNGAHVLIHCAAGIHRTGFFLYALLRVCGHSPEETMAAIEVIRHVTAVQAGTDRFQLSESLAMKLIDCGLPTEQLRNPGFTLRVVFHKTASGHLLISVVLLGEHTEESLRHTLCIPLHVHELLPEKVCSQAGQEAYRQEMEEGEPVDPREADDVLVTLITAQSSGPFVPDVKTGCRPALEAFFPKLASLLYP